MDFSVDNSIKLDYDITNKTGRRKIYAEDFT
nr:MAG TPA: hypothetical protein [Caudoviricetes sp.]